MLAASRSLSCLWSTRYHKFPLTVVCPLRKVHTASPNRRWFKFAQDRQKNAQAPNTPTKPAKPAKVISSEHRSNSSALVGECNCGHEVNNVDRVTSRNTLGIGRLSDGTVRARSTRFQFRNVGSCNNMTLGSRDNELESALHIVDNDHNGMATTTTS